MRNKYYAWYLFRIKVNMKSLRLGPLQVSVAFFKSESFYEGLRTTIGIVLPVWLLFTTDQIQATTDTGLGAFMLALSDTPRDLRKKMVSLSLKILPVYGIKRQR